MKIENQYPNGSAKQLNRTQNHGAVPVERKEHPTDQGARPDRLNGKDAAVLSERARLLARARLALEETGQDAGLEVREERVRLLQEQVANGNYQVPVEALVKKLYARLKAEG
jgi:anti-sigma28 factor (negative regulator of flagellin synthesis)